MKLKQIFLITFCVAFVAAVSVHADSTKVEAPKADSIKAKAVSCDLSCFDWLPGTWQMVHADLIVNEVWKKDSNSLAGLGFTLKGQDTTGLEKMWMQATDSGFFFIAEVSQNPAPVLFKLVSSDSSRFVFENPTHDFPQRVIYQLIAADSLRARIEGKIQDQERGINFPYARVK